MKNRKNILVSVHSLTKTSPPSLFSSLGDEDNSSPPSLSLEMTITIMFFYLIAVAVLRWLHCRLFGCWRIFNEVFLEKRITWFFLWTTQRSPFLAFPLPNVRFLKLSSLITVFVICCADMLKLFNEVSPATDSPSSFLCSCKLPCKTWSNVLEYFSTVLAF